MKTIIFVFMLFIELTVIGQTIDLNKLTLNDSILKELAIDQITNILGRPSAVEKHELTSSIIGPELFYHNKGLSISFLPKSQDSLQRVKSIKIYLARTWDKKFNEFYLSFLGKIIPQVNSNIKNKDLLPLFNNDSIKYTSAEDNRGRMEADFKKMGAMKYFDSSTVFYDITVIIRKNVRLVFECEPVTKFLETVRIDVNVIELL